MKLNIIIIMHLIYTILTSLYCSIMNIAIFRPTIQPFYIDNKKYREAINPIFAFGFKKTSIYISEKPIATYLGNIYYGQNQLQNIIFRNNIWKPIDKIYISSEQEQIIYILASTFGLRQSMHYKITVNNITIANPYMKNLDYFNNITVRRGEHIIMLWGKSNTPIGLCPSTGKGYSMSYQFVAWKTASKSKHAYSSNKIRKPVYQSNPVINITGLIDNETVILPKINIIYSMIGSLLLYSNNL